MTNDDVDNIEALRAGLRNMLSNDSPGSVEDAIVNAFTGVWRRLEELEHYAGPTRLRLPIEADPTLIGPVARQVDYDAIADMVPDLRIPATATSPVPRDERKAALRARVQAKIAARKPDEPEITSNKKDHRFVANPERGPKWERCIDCGIEWPEYGDLAPMPMCRGTGYGEPEGEEPQPDEPAERCGACGGGGNIRINPETGCYEHCDACNGTGTPPQPVAAVSGEGASRRWRPLTAGGECEECGYDPNDYQQSFADRDRLARELERSEREREQGRQALVGCINERDTLQAERDVWSGKACEEEQSAGNGPCGACRHCLPGLLKLAGSERDAALTRIRELEAALDDSIAALRNVDLKLQAALDAAASGDGEPGARG